ncbi:hypothetical protein GSB9_01618 [Flavobacteriaceae bacterium GSB9]|nr:hypothetical protein GSB9_01618 [Flavobacteriaceae bacterium GSB9]
MIARWCISILIFSLTLFGVVSQQQVVLPNQEIVLRFTEVDLSSQYAKVTIDVLKRQLQDLGAKNIKVNTAENGQVNIAYYSQSEATSIKKTLTEGSFLALEFLSDSNSEHSPAPSKDKDGVYYNFDVFEIQKGDNHGRSLKGNIVLQFETKSDRFLEPNFHICCNQIDSKEENALPELAYAIQRNIVLSIKDTPYKIPEGRAGPRLS